MPKKKPEKPTQQPQPLQSRPELGHNRLGAFVQQVANEQRVGWLCCVACRKEIALGQSFVRIREDKTKREMKLAHDTCHPDPNLKRRVMSEQLAGAIRDYGK